MRYRFYLLLPLVLVSACNGSDNSKQISQSTFDDLKTKLDVAEKDRAALASEKEALASEKEALASEKEALATKNAELVTKNAVLIDEKTKFEKERGESLEKLTTANVEIEALTKQYSSAIVERDALKDKFNTVNAAYKEALDASAECSKKYETALTLGTITEEQKLELGKSCDVAKSNLASLEKDRDAARTDLDAANKKVTDLTTRLEKSEADRLAAIADRDKLNAALDELVKNACH